MNSAENDSDSDCGPALPAGVLRSRGGWDGDNLEIDHQRERLRSGNNEDEMPAAVDLSQFRNEEVGKGYQAKHVIRQKGITLATGSKTGVVDMSGGKFTQNDKLGDEDDARTGSSSKKRGLERGDKDSGRKRQHKDPRLESYLKCKGMRDFLRETEKILQKNA